MVDYCRGFKLAISLFLILLLLNGVALAQEGENQNQENQEQAQEQKEKSFWDQVVEGFTNFFKAVIDTLTFVKDFLFDILGRIWNFLVTVAGLLIEGANAVVLVITNTFKTLMSFIGNWGDPELYFQIQMARLLYPDATASAVYVRDVALLINNPELLKDNRAIDEVTPTGVLGMISLFVYAVQKGAPIVQFILQNFILIHVVIIIGILAWGMIGAIEKRDADYFIEACARVYAIFAFYAKIVKWFIEKIIDFGTLVAQWLDTIIPF